MSTKNYSIIPRGVYALISALIYTLLLLPLTGCPLLLNKPNAAFSANVVSGAVPLPVVFTDWSNAGSFPVTAWHFPISERLWNFGDGTTSTQSKPGHFYSAVGTYTVSLTVTSKLGSDTETKIAYITVTKGTPHLQVLPTATPITYGQTLADATLTGGETSVEGTFAFSAPDTAPPAGAYQADVTFTPVDLANYNPVTTTVSVTVNPATPVISQWPTATPITFGQTLANATLTGGLASVEGTFAFSTPDTAPPAGAYDAAVTFTPSDTANYSLVSGVVAVAVNLPASLVYEWPVASPITFGQTLAVSTLSGGLASVEGTFAFSAPGVSPLVGIYTAPVRFTPADTARYAPVNGAVPVTVDKAIPTIYRWPSANAITYGQTLADTTLSNSAVSIPGSFAFDKPQSLPSTGAYPAPVTFTPADTALYASVSGIVNVPVNPINGSIWFVAPGGAGSGSSWNDPMGSVQTAVETVADSGGGEIWVAAGTYTAITDTVLRMAAGAHLYGGFAGNESTRDARDWSMNKTIIDGQSERRCVTGADNATLDGFVVQNGYAYEGAGMFNKNASPTIANCTFKDNAVTGMYGAGIFNQHASPTITSCSFENNGILPDSSSFTYGGGIANLDLSSPTIRNCLFAENAAVIGGGIYAEYAPLTVEDCTFIRNKALVGGGISTRLLALTMRNCRFLENGARGGGAGYLISSLTTTLTNCAFHGNNATGHGAALYLDSADTFITNCTFTKNAAGYDGGAIFNHYAAQRMTNCTFAENTAGVSGGGLAGSNSSQTITNCIFWNNAAATIGTSQFDPEGIHEPNTYHVTYSCVQGGYEGTGNIDADPRLANLRYGNVGLLADSPCIDTGSPELAPDTDIQNIPRPQGAGVDMGATEWDDADADNLSDTWERRYFSDLAAQAAEDPDNDAWNNSEEYAQGTNPTQADTDGDGYQDNEENALGWDPTRVSGIRYVNAANTAEVQDGRSWATAFVSIQAAIDSVEEGEIWVAAGTYTASHHAVVIMKPRVLLFGGFAGDETLREARDWETYPTKIDGQSARRCVIGADNTSLDGFIVQNGYTKDFGAGMFITIASPAISNCSFIDNLAENHGGGIAAYFSESPVTNCIFKRNSAYSAGGLHACDCTMTITDAEFNANTATEYGAAILNSESTLTLSRCAFVENTTSAYNRGSGSMCSFDANNTLTDCTFVQNSAIKGGALSSFSASETLIRCTFSQNSAQEAGAVYLSRSVAGFRECQFIENTAQNNAGAIYNDVARLTEINMCTFTDNTAGEKGGALYNYDLEDRIITKCLFSGNTAVDGAAIYNQQATPRITDCRFTDNEATGSGAGIYNQSSAPIVTNTIFINNTAGSGGAGIYNQSSAPIVTNTIFVNNTAGSGGAMMFNRNANPILYHCTATENVANAGPVLYNESKSHVTASNCIFWNNTNRSLQGDIFSEGSTATITYSCLQNGYPGPGNIQTDPLFMNPANGDYTLQPTSPCIDTASPDSATETDILGIPRPQGNGFDMGAYEFVSPK